MRYYPLLWRGSNFRAFPLNTRYGSNFRAIMNIKMLRSSLLHFAVSL